MNEENKIEVVAEVGCNWLGDEHLAANMISKAKNAGASSVKFQAFKAEAVAGHPKAKEIAKAAVTENNVKLLKDLADLNTIEFFCTPMFPEAVDFLDPFVKKWKIRERDSRPIINPEGSTNSMPPTPLLERVMKTGKPIYMSVQRRPGDNFWRFLAHIKYLYVRPDYPAKLEDLELWRCENGYGYSNHCPDIIAPIAAAALMLNERGHNARIIEVHVSEEPKANFVDGNVSFSFEELKTIVDSIRKLERMKLEKIV